MSDFLDEVLSVNHGDETKKLPSEWRPHVETYGDTATGVAGPFDSNSVDDRDLIAGWQLDPDVWEIVGEVNCRRWQTYDERWLHYFKANLQKRSAGVDRVDIDKLCKLAEKRKPIKIPSTTGERRSMYLSICDLQLGKTDMNGGTEGTVDFLLSALDRFGERVKELRRVGRPVDEIVIANNGDLVERIAGHYPSQQFMTDLDEREQMRLARRIFFRAIDLAAGLAPKVTVTSTICNHGENRQNGKAISSPSDNLGHVIIESVEEACQQNPDRYGHVSFLYAKDFNIVHEVSGVTVCANHGHQVRGSGSGSATMNKWWLKQIMGNQPPAAADLLITAHKHHFEMSEESGRTMFMSPASDPGSLWFTSASGASSPRGLLSLCIGDAYERGWGDMEIISGAE